MSGRDVKTVYLKCERNIEVQSPDVFLSDIATVRCADKVMAARLQAVKVHHFPPDSDKRVVISTLKLVDLMERECENIHVEIVGEPDVLVEWIFVNKYKGWRQWLKTILVCLVSFFGTSFTIMAYHNDIGINAIFTEVYRMIMNKEPTGLNILEVSYSLGLAAGIALFFNHIGGKRFVNDATPLEVSIRKYEEDVDKALIAQAGREGQEKE